jgi:hypothetical protein
MRRVFAVWLALCATGVLAQESAYTVRATELKAKPFADAATLTKLAEHAQVEVISRQASWMQVKAAAGTGWVKFLSLRLGDGNARGKAGDGGLQALFNVAATGKSGGTTTTGVRGLSEEKLKNAQPDPQALRSLQDYAVSGRDAQGFAEAGKLEAQRLDYLAAPEKEKK